MYKQRGLKGAELESAVNGALESAEHKAMIDSEVTAELVGQALNNDKFLSRYARIGNTDGFIKKAWSFLRSMVKELKGKGDENNELADIIMPTIRSMDRLLQMDNSKEGVEWEKRYAINENFNNQIDNWDGKTIGFSFVVGETSQALQEAGIPNKQIRWDASKIVKLLDKHSGMTKEIVKQIPYLLENPIIVIDSKQNSNAKIVMGDLYDSNGKMITVVLLLTPTSKKGNVLKMIKISSAEGRGHIQSLFKNDDGSPVAVRYVDKKRIQSWLNVNRLQLPLHNLDLDSYTKMSLLSIVL